MKKLITFFTVFFLSFVAFGQELTGSVCRYKDGQPIDRIAQFFISGNGKMVSVKVDSLGTFKVKEQEVEKLGNILTVQIGGLGTDYRYADFQIVNIPSDSLKLALKKIFVKDAFLVPSCGSDCFTVNNKRTYRDKEFTVDNGEIIYKVKRVPYKGKIKQSPFFKVTYQTDFKEDVIKI